MARLNTIYEDAEILVINKPAGLRVDADPETGESVEQILNFPLERSGIVHRLDKETSGVLIIAKTQEALESLRKQFHDHCVRKIYKCLVYGQTDSQGTIKSFIARDPKRKQAMKVIDYPVGLERGKLREAVTHYKTISNFKFKLTNLSLLEVEIETGRTHQIRVHMQSIGHPIIGDEMYNTKTSKEVSQTIGLNRQFLHAEILEINNPKTGEMQTFTSPLPEDLENKLNELENA